MAITSAELKFKKSIVSDDTSNNGARIHNDDVSSLYFPDVTSMERQAGLTRYRKLFLKNENNTAGLVGLTLTSAKAWLKRPTPAGVYGSASNNEYFLLKAGSDTDIQSGASAYTNWSGVGYLNAASYSAGATSIAVVCEPAAGSTSFRTTGIAFIGYYDTAGNLTVGEFVTVSNMTSSGNIATLTISALLNTYAQYETNSQKLDASIYSSTTIGKAASAWSVNAFQNQYVLIYGGTGIGQMRKVASNTADTITVDYAWNTTPDATSDFMVLKTYVSMCEDLASIVCSHGTITVTSPTGGTFNTAYFYDYPIGAVTESWTITFGATSGDYTVTGNNYYGVVATGNISAGIKPSNSGSGSYYFEMAAAGFGGTFGAGETITFTTTNSAKGFWAKETIVAGTLPHSANKVEIMVSGDTA